MHSCLFCGDRDRPRGVAVGGIMMNQSDYGAMSDRQLRKYFLQHREVLSS